MTAGSLNVWIRNADASLVQLTSSVAPIASMVPAWTADGKRIVFESNRAVPPEASTENDPYDVSLGLAVCGGQQLAASLSDNQ
jgi:Tol biopolymer transport system component